MMTMINYRNLAGGEVTYLDGIMYFWVRDGVYTVEARRVKKYKCQAESRRVVLDLVDTEPDYHKTATKSFNTELNDFELIYRFICGSAACDCVRGNLMYGPEQHYNCNEGANRFIVRKMAIKGETNNCVLEYKEYR